jgi:hypothetical protein
VAGIEPASFGISSGLLRAQPASAFLGPGDHAGKSPTGSVTVGCSPDSRDRNQAWSSLADAETGSRALPARQRRSLRQRERTRTASYRQLFGCRGWLTRSRDILGPLHLIRRPKSKPDTPICSYQRAPQRTRSRVRHSAIQPIRVNGGTKDDIPVPESRQRSQQSVPGPRPSRAHSAPQQKLILEKSVGYPRVGDRFLQDQPLAGRRARSRGVYSLPRRAGSAFRCRMSA